MQTSTLLKADVRPTTAAPVSSSRSRQGSTAAAAQPFVVQEMLVPFLAELSRVDTRNDDARASAREERGTGADAESAGLAGVSATMNQDIQEAERSLRAPSRAFQRGQNRDEMRAQRAAQRDTQQRASDKSAQEPSANQRGKSESPRTAAAPSGKSAVDQPARSPSGPRDTETEHVPQKPARADAGEPHTRPGSSTAGTDRTAQTAASARVAAPAAAPAIAPPPSNRPSALSPAAELAGKTAASGRSSSAQGVRAVESATAAQAPASAASGAKGSGAGASSPDSSPAPRASQEPAGPRGVRDGQSPPAAGSEESKNDANVKQMLRVIRGQIDPSHSHVTMRLEPAALGSIRISMDLNQRVMDLRITAESHLAQRVLSEKGHELRDALDASGIRLDRFEVRAPQPAPEGHTPGQPPDAGHQNAGDGSTHSGAERSSDQRESESPASRTATVDPREDQVERTTESSLNVLA